MQIDEILKLSEEERMLAIEKIWESLDHKKLPIKNTQLEELQRRLERYQAGKTKFYAWNEIKEELHKNTGK
jgi:putative addiction module component (TIGR02574 family)